MMMHMKIEAKYCPRDLETLDGGHPVVQMLVIHNLGDPIEGASLELRTTSGVLVPTELPLPLLETGSLNQLMEIQELELDMAYLESLCHELTTELVMTVMHNGQPIYAKAHQILVDKLGNITYEEEET